MTSQLWPSATVEEMQAINHLQRMSCAPQAAACLIRRIAEFDPSGDLPDVRCPTLVLHNPLDLRAPFELGRLAASTIPGA